MMRSVGISWNLLVLMIKCLVIIGMRARVACHTVRSNLQSNAVRFSHIAHKVARLNMKLCTRQMICFIRLKFDGIANIPRQ